MALSSPGIGSNLDVNGIVAKLMTTEQGPLNLITAHENKIQTTISTYGSIKSALSSFQTATSSLADVSKFKALSATSSDSASIAITAGLNATASSYAINVSQLAQNQKLVANGQSDVNAAIGIGTLTFDFGTISGGSKDGAGHYTGSTFTSNGSGTKQVVIDSTNNSLAGIRDAINSAQIGVTASIVNDGSATPYRLVLTDKSTGVANSMKISVSGDANLTGFLSQDPSSATSAGQALSESQTAQNALFTLDGVAISKASNTVTDAIDGSTINLLKTTSAPVALTVAQDNSTITNSITQFVNAYNQINKTLSAATAYNPTTKVAGPLNGDSTITGIQKQLRNVLTKPVNTGNSAMTYLSQLGVTLQSDGTLGVDQAKLSAGLTSSSKSVAALFAAFGSSSDSLVGYTSSTANTKPGNYAVSVSQLSTKGAYNGSTASGLTVTTGTNDQLSVLLNGTTATVTIPAGTYTADSLAKQIQTQINGNTAFTGSSVTVSQNSGILSIVANNYGSGSNVSIVGGNNPSYFFGAGTSTAGQDVSGSINGIAATGSGQSLRGAIGDTSEGLTLSINGGATGSRGSVTYSQGYAYQFNALVTNILGDAGSIQTKTNGLNSTLKSLQRDETSENSRLVAIEARYRAEFTSLDKIVGTLSTTSSFLSQQLSKL